MRLNTYINVSVGLKVYRKICILSKLHNLGIRDVIVEAINRMFLDDVTNNILDEDLQKANARVSQMND